MVKVDICCMDEKKYFDGGLVSNLDALKKAVRQDWDGLLLVFGREGVGKSTFALQLGSYLDDNFCLDRVCWTPKQFIEKVMKAPPYSCIILDEAYLTFVHQSAVDWLQKIVISMLTMIRSHNLFIIIVSPTIFDLKKYLVVHRALAAFRCYHHGMQRGFWEMYGEESKLKLYVKGRRDNDLRVADAEIRGKFTKWFPVDKEEYIKRKEAAIEELRQKIMKPKKEKDELAEAFLDGEISIVSWLKDGAWLKRGAAGAISDYWDVNIASFWRRIKRIKGKRERYTAKGGKSPLEPHQPYINLKEDGAGDDEGRGKSK